ncbi:MAG: penicillin-binding protein, partial [Elusimicrobiota bacterium]
AALRPETCATLLEVMRGVLGPEGTAHAAALKTGFNLPAAGKTGTTNEYKDAWFAGVTPELSAAVWIGHDDMRLSLGHGKAGGSTAAPIWMEFVKAAYRDRPARGFAPAEGKK